MPCHAENNNDIPEPPSYSYLHNAGSFLQHQLQQGWFFTSVLSAQQAKFVVNE
jgi:hypothetical protein